MNKNTYLVLGIVALVIIIAVVINISADSNEANDFLTDGSDTDQVLVKTTNESVSYFGNSQGYLAKPAEEGEYPALVMIHEWWGLNEHIRDMADEYAAQGYVVLAVDLYAGEVASTPDEAGQLAGAVREDTETAFANLRAATDYLKSSESVNSSKLAAIGWCFGGDWAYRMATNDFGLDASVMYYGRFSDNDDLDMMRTALLGHFGEEDSLIEVDNVREFKARLESADEKHAVYIYPNAGHAFSNSNRQDSYNPEAAELARERTLDFLDQNIQ